KDEILKQINSKPDLIVLNVNNIGTGSDILYFQGRFLQWQQLHPILNKYKYVILPGKYNLNIISLDTDDKLVEQLVEYSSFSNTTEWFEIEQTKVEIDRKIFELNSTIANYQRHIDDTKV